MLCPYRSVQLLRSSNCLKSGRPPAVFHADHLHCTSISCHVKDFLSDCFTIRTFVGQSDDLSHFRCSAAIRGGRRRRFTEFPWRFMTYCTKSSLFFGQLAHLINFQNFVIFYVRCHTILSDHKALPFQDRRKGGKPPDGRSPRGNRDDP